MAPNTALNFGLIGLLLLLSGYKRCPKLVLYALLGTTAFISVLSIIGYTYGLKVLFGIAGFNPMAVHTAVCFLLVDLLVLRRLLNVGKLYVDGKIIALLVVAMLIVIGSGVGTQRILQEADDQQAAAGRSDAVLVQTDALRSTLLNAETGQRGFLLTGRTEYLKPYEQATQQIDAAFNALQNQLRATAYQSNVTLVQELTQQKLAELAKTIELKQAGNTAAALAIVNTNIGKEYTEKIEQQLAQIEQGQKAEKNRFAANAARDRQVMIWLLAAGTAVNVVLLVTACVFIQRSIAQRLEAETEERELARTLKAERQQLQAILSSLPVGVFVAAAPTGKPLLVNTKAEELLGVGVDKSAGKDKYAEAYQLVLPDGTPYPAAELPLVHTLATGKPAVKDDITVKRPDGKLLAMRATSAPILDSDGHMRRAVVVSEDITKERELDKAKDGLISLVSHQLRTPATAVKQFLGMVLEDYVGDSKNLTPKQRDMLQQADASNNELIQLITDILDIARLEAGTTQPQIVPGDLSAVLHDLADRQKHLLADKQQKLDVVLPASVEQILFDKSLLLSAIDNLVNNASKYSPAGSRVGLTLEISKGQAAIMVEDDGPGIAKADLPKLFNRFSRLDPSVNGTGLGLYLVKLVAELHGGTVSVKSHVGKGSTFSIIIPTGGK